MSLPALSSSMHGIRSAHKLNTWQMSPQSGAKLAGVTGIETSMFDSVVEQSRRLTRGGRDRAPMSYCSSLLRRCPSKRKTNGNLAALQRNAERVGKVQFTTMRPRRAARPRQPAIFESTKPDGMADFFSFKAVFDLAGVVLLSVGAAVLTPVAEPIISLAGVGRASRIALWLIARCYD